MNELLIKKVENGYIITYEEDNGDGPMTVSKVFNTDEIQEDENSRNFCYMLWAITHHFEENRSKHDDKQISIELRHEENDKPVFEF